MKPDIVQSDHQNHESMVALMRGFFETDKPKVGIFWYDYVNNTLFGVEKDDADKYATERGWGTLPKLHKTYWQKQHFRAVAKNDTASIFYQEKNYTMIPRGRVFINGGKYYVAVGSWINGKIGEEQCIEADKLRDLIIDTFDLPEDFVFYQDRHWDIGHGWSEDNLNDLDALVP